MSERIDWTSIACAYCGAGVGNRCVTASGKESYLPHSSRMRPLSRAYLVGYLDAERGLLDNPDHYERMRSLRQKRKADA